MPFNSFKPCFLQQRRSGLANRIPYELAVQHENILNFLLGFICFFSVTLEKIIVKVCHSGIHLQQSISYQLLVSTLTVLDNLSEQ